MCKFGAPENKFIAMLIIFYFFNLLFCWFFFLYDNQTCTVPGLCAIL